MSALLITRTRRAPTPTGGPVASPMDGLVDGELVGPLSKSRPLHYKLMCFVRPDLYLHPSVIGEEKSKGITTILEQHRAKRDFQLVRPGLRSIGADLLPCHSATATPVSS